MREPRYKGVGAVGRGARGGLEEKKKTQTEGERRKEKKLDRNLGYCLVQRRYHRRRGSSVLDVTAAGRNEDMRGLLTQRPPPVSGQCSRFVFLSFSGLVIASVFRTERLFSSGLQEHKSLPPIKKSDILWRPFPHQTALFQNVPPLAGC